MFYVNSLKRSVEAASQHLLQAAAARGMTPVGRHIMTWHRIAAGAEHGSECRIYDFCNAVLMRQSLEASQLAAVAMPCRVAVYEDTGGVKLAMMKLAAFLAASSKPRVYEPFAEMEQTLIDAIREVCDGKPGEVDPADAELPDGINSAAAAPAPCRLEFA